MANITKIYEIKVQGQGIVKDEMKQVNKEFDAAAAKWKELKKLIAAGGLSSADTTKYKAELSKAKIETERLRQEQIKLRNESLALANAQKQQSSESGKQKSSLSEAKTETEKLRQETIKLKNESLALSNAQKQQAADQKRAREETRLSTDEWKKLLAQLNTARNNAKNTAVKFGIDSTEFKDAAKAANDLDSKVKQIESRLGQFQRNVGNYPGNRMLQGLNTNVLESMIKSGFGTVIANQINLAKEKSRELDQQLATLRQRLDQIKQSGTGDLQAVEQAIIENRREAQQLNTEVSRIQTQFRNATNMGAKMTESIKGYFRNLKSEITTFLVGYLSFQTAMAKTQELIQNTYELADGVTAVEVELGKAAGGAQNLIDKLAGLDTRTKILELTNLANIAIKAGVQEGDVVGVVSAVDKIKVAFGKDFGDVETGTETLVKLNNIFNNGKVTEDGMLRTGNAIRTIANESVASVPFLNDFAKRMAGVKGISEITLPAVLGLASGFEQYGQSAETTSTALVRILPKIAADTEKFSKIAGMTKEAFSKMLNESPDQALIKVAEGLTKNKGKLEDLIASFKDSELAGNGGAGITSTIGVLGKNAETFKKSIESAKNAYNDTSNITEAFAKKNENLSASMDKLKKGFVDAANNQKFQSFLKNSISLITVLGSAIAGIPFSVWIGLITLLTLAYWQNIQAMAVSIAQSIVYAARTIIGNALITASNILIRAQAVAVMAANAAWRVLNATMLFLGTIIPGIRTAWISLNLTMMGTPIGLVVAGIAAIGAALVLMSSKAQESGKILKQNADQMKLNAEISRKVSETTSDVISKVQILTRIIKDNSIAYDTKKKALQGLIAISPQHLQALTLENIKTAEGTKILEEYRKKLIEVAKAKAVESLIQEKQKRLVELEMKALEDANNKIEADKFKNNVFDSRSWGEFARGVGGMVGIGQGDSEDVYNKNLKERISLQKEIKSLSETQVKNINAGLPSDIVGDNSPAARTLASLKAELDALNEEFSTTEINSKRYFELKKEIAKKQAYYDSLTKTDKTKDKASSLSAQQKDFIKDLDASNKDRLSAIEDNFAKGKIIEDTYIKQSLASNVKYFDAKIAYLKKGNAEERKQVAQAQFDKAKSEREANDKLFELNKKRVDNSLKIKESEISKRKDSVMNDPYSTDQEKLDAEKKFYEESSAAATTYYLDMLFLQSQYSKKSQEEASAMLNAMDDKIQQENRNSKEYRIKATKISFNVVDETSEQISNGNEMNAVSQRKIILQSRELTNAQKKIELEKIAAQLELGNINSQLGNTIAKIRLLEDEMRVRELTNDEMREFNRLLKERQTLELGKAQAEQNVTDTGSALPSGAGIPGSGASGLAATLTKKLGGKDGKIMIGGTDYSEQAGFAIAAAFDMAQNSMNAYFDAERNRIEQSKQLAYERIDLETKQLLRFAQSSAERERIEKEAAEKKKKADKEAGEKLKKTKKTEAKIAFLMQLANIWSTAMQLGPIAGPIMGGVLSILAGVQYASTIKGIDSAQYKRGGKFLGNGGKLNGPSHSDGGMPVYDPISGNKVAEVEGGEGIINQNSMKDQNIYNISGTPSQIASKINSIGGGIDWDGGATMKKFLKGGQYLGSNLQAPFIKSYYDSTNNALSYSENSERLNRIESKIEDLTDLQMQESMKKVVISGREITEDQKERKKRTEIATL